MAWLAPALGELEPRLAGVAGGMLVAGELAVPLDPSLLYQTLTSVDLDRDGRDTVAVSSLTGSMPVQHAVTVVKLDTGSRRTLEVGRSQHLGWGDNDHDAFGIDARLGVHTALAADGYRFVASAPIAPPAMPFTAVELSISGASSRSILTP